MIAYLAHVIYLHRVTELNMGIICCCTAVNFVVLRGLIEKTRALFLSLIGNLSLRPSLYEQVNHENSTGNEGHHPRDELPQVPKGTLNTLPSFVRRYSRMQGTKNRDSGIQAGTFVELQSVDTDYHSHVP